GQDPGASGAPARLEPSGAVRLAEAGGAVFVLGGGGQLEAEDVLVRERELFVLRGRERQVVVLQVDADDARDCEQIARRGYEAGGLPLLADLERTAAALDP